MPSSIRSTPLRTDQGRRARHSRWSPHQSRLAERLLIRPASPISLAVHRQAAAVSDGAALPQFTPSGPTANPNHRVVPDATKTRARSPPSLGSRQPHQMIQAKEKAGEKCSNSRGALHDLRGMPRGQQKAISFGSGQVRSKQVITQAERQVPCPSFRRCASCRG